MVEISREFKSRNHYGRNGDKVELVVIHSTEGHFPGCAEWLCNSNALASAHYLITRSGKVYGLVEESRAAWHAGKSFFDFDGNGEVVASEKRINRRSIGIELEAVRGDYTEVQLGLLKVLVETLVSRYGIARERVVGHREIAAGRKSDPVGFDMENFRRSLHESF